MLTLIHLPSFSSLFPSPYLTCCAIVLTSFGGKIPQFDAMTGRTAPSFDVLLDEVFWGIPQL